MALYRDIRAIAFVVGMMFSIPATLAQSVPDEEALLTRARAIHERVLVLDTHVDFLPSNFTSERNYTQRLDNQFNLPKMFDGGIDATFLIVYVGQTREAQNPDAFTAAGYERAYKAAIEKFEAIHWLAKELVPEKVELALTAADVRRIDANGKKAVLIGVENGYPIGEEIGRVKEFYDRGARYLSLSHNGHSQLSDSNTGERDGWKWNGLSPLGKQVIAEMNRVGLMIDVSHPSKASMMQSVELSKAPIIASHSSVRALCDVSRNLDDEQLLALKKNGGVIQIVAFGSYIKTQKPDSPERATALTSLRREF
ncbi:MAG TPA: membrane dipeptidase, partial [Candidatus Binatia bacterium]|nr:membrane dipeptidase [Candidatus Binatia bacterium]